MVLLDARDEPAFPEPLVIGNGMREHLSHRNNIAAQRALELSGPQRRGLFSAEQIAQMFRPEAHAKRAPMIGIV
jgi:hypothetical protein